MDEDIAISIASREENSAELVAVRMAVFVREQKVPEEIEVDDQDSQCVHVIARTGAGDAVGTARLAKNGHIGP